MLFLTGTGTLPLIVKFRLALVFDQLSIQSVKLSLHRRSAKHMNVTTEIKILLLSPPPKVITMWCLNTGTNLFIQCAAFNVTHFESRITHLLYTAVGVRESVSKNLSFQIPP